MLFKGFREFLEDESGQGITEYACILAFVSLLVVLVFGITNGTLENALQESFSSIAGQLERLSSGATAT